MPGFLDVRVDDAEGQSGATESSAETPDGGYQRLGFVGWALLIVFVVSGLAGLATALASTYLPERYESTAKILLVPAREASGASFANDAERVAATQRDIIISYTTLAPVARQLGVASVLELQRSLSVETPANSDVLSITVSDQDPRRARDLVGAIVTSYLSFLEGRGRATLTGGRVLDPGRVPEEAASPLPLRNGGVAAVLALIVVGAIAVLTRTRARQGAYHQSPDVPQYGAAGR